MVTGDFEDAVVVFTAVIVVVVDDDDNVAVTVVGFVPDELDRTMSAVEFGC